MDTAEWVDNADRYARHFGAMVRDDADRLAQWIERELTGLGPWTVDTRADDGALMLEAMYERKADIPPLAEDGQTILGTWVVVNLVEGPSLVREAVLESILAFRLRIEQHAAGSLVSGDFVCEDLHAFNDYALLCEDMVSCLGGDVRQSPEWTLAGSPQPKDAAEGTNPSVPRKETLRRFNLFKDIKDEHPEWSYSRVAAAATRGAKAHKDPNVDPPIYKAHDVRNAYKAAGVLWGRSNRIKK